MVHGSLARPRRVGGALVAAGVLAVTGCSGSGQGDAPPPPSTAPDAAVTSTNSPTETAQPSPTETSPLPPLPDAAKENTPEGAEAFIRYYFDVANGLYQDPPGVAEVDQIIGERLVDPECISCETLRDELVQLSESDQRTLGVLYSIDSIERIGGGSPGVQRFNMTMTLSDYVVEDAAGQRYEYKGGEVEGVGAAIWTGAQWVIYGMELG